MMFPKFDWDEKITAEFDDKFLTIRQVVDIVFSHIKNGQKDRYNTIKDALRGYIEEIDADHTTVNLLRKRWDDCSSEDSNIYHELGKKYGYEKWDSNKKDPKYKEFVVAKRKTEKQYNIYSKERNSSVKKMYNSFRDRYKHHSYQCIFEYGDRYGEYILENGWIFRNLPHIKVSNH